MYSAQFSATDSNGSATTGAQFFVPFQDILSRESGNKEEEKNKRGMKKDKGRNYGESMKENESGIQNIR